MLKRSVLAGVIVSALSGVAAGQQSAVMAHAFAVADVHESPSVKVPYAYGGQLQGDRYILRQSTIVEMAARAYGVKPEMIQGGPTWLELRRFDVTAKADPRTSDADLKLMLQSLLADRFKLRMHKGDATMPAFLLTAPSGKTTMRQSAEGSEKGCKPGSTPETAGGAPLITLSCTGMTADGVATLVSQVAASELTEPVLNQTGLDGTYDFSLRWTDIRQRAKAGADAVPISSAIATDLGLKLELKKAPRSVWIVDGATELPTPNSADVAKELPAVPPREFEVATIKPNRPGAQQGGRIGNGQINVTAMPLKFLITLAWDLSPNDRQAIANGPEWLETDRFDIVAKAAMPDVTAGRTATQFDDQEFRQMLRGLLIERFRMHVRMEDRPIEAYKMVADHPKLKEADPKSRTHCKEGPGPDGKDPRIANPMLTALWTCQNTTMKQLGEELAHYATGYVYAPVVDATGLKGSYDFTMAWSSASLTILKPPPTPGEQQPSSEPNGAVTLDEAMRSQIGIRLVKEKRPVPVLVIDHIDRTPTEN